MFFGQMNIKGGGLVMENSATKQRNQIVNSFLGNEEENLALLRRGRIAYYDPSVEFFINSARECLVAVVRSLESDRSGNPVYRITNLKLLGVIEKFALATNGVVYYFKIPVEAFKEG